MGQMKLFPDESEGDPVPIVNVASVPKRSPFRYPGGKTWLVPRIREWLGTRTRKASLLLEPFAGGAIVGLTAAFEELVSHVCLVELDPDVAAVWTTIITDGNGPWLAERIANFEVSEQSVMWELSKEPQDTRERAWRTILRNRMQRGGILAPGAGLIRKGENGKGLTSRWYPNTLARRILDIHRIRNRMTFLHDDGLEAMRAHVHNRNAAVFIDPPYTAGTNGKRAGSRLYAFNQLDHEELFRLAHTMLGDVLLTYDNSPEVAAMALRHGFNVEAIPMKNTHHAEMTELLIGRELGWIGLGR